MRTFIPLLLFILYLGSLRTSSAQSYSFKLWAGQPGSPGATDGPAGTARFNQPMGIAVDQQGNAYVCDRANSTIRKISPDGIVSTLAGAVGSAGAIDGSAALARFKDPSGIAVDRAGNVFVADTGNFTIRKITTTGTVSTFAGQTGASGFIDGAADLARFTQPSSLSIDRADNLYVSDQDRIRKITPIGVVSTVAIGPGPIDAVTSSPVGQLYGAAYVQLFRVTDDGRTNLQAGLTGMGPKGFADGSIVVARFDGIRGLTVDDGGNVYATDPGNHAIRRISPTAQVTTLSALAGQASADNALLDAPTGIALDRLGHLYVTDVNSSCIYRGTTENVGHLINLSARAQVDTSAGVLITGFITSGVGSKPMLVRGIGPTLSQFGVGGSLARPQITLLNSSGEVESSNAGWANNSALAASFAEVGAFPLPSNSLDAALRIPVSAGIHTVILTGVGGTRGVGLAEIYDADPTNSAFRLINISARGQVGAGDAVLIVGFIINEGVERVLIRGVGPGLIPFGVPGTLDNPKLQLYQNRMLTAENDDWDNSAELTTAFAQAGAFALASSSKDAAMIVTLTPGAYTAVLSPADNHPGVGILELYEIK